ncbi:MAG: hypothetical protein QXL01_03695 [Thermoplasmatales archaeon]
MQVLMVGTGQHLVMWRQFGGCSGVEKRNGATTANWRTVGVKGAGQDYNGSRSLDCKTLFDKIVEWWKEKPSLYHTNPYNLIVARNN